MPGRTGPAHAPQLGAWIYTGVGLGIALAGAVAWLGGHAARPMAVAGAGRCSRFAAGIVAWLSVPLPARESSKAQRGKSRATARGVWRRHAGLVFCYGTFGFGYIVPATFLPAMARQLVRSAGVRTHVAAVRPGRVRFRCGGARWLAEWPRARVWALAQAVMALGTALPLTTQTLWALAAHAVLVGGTFMVATMAGLQLARELDPGRPTPLLARMTVAFAPGRSPGRSLIRLLGPGLGRLGRACLGLRRRNRLARRVVALALALSQIRSTFVS